MADLCHLFEGRPFTLEPRPFWHRPVSGNACSTDFPLAPGNDSRLPDQWRLPVEAGWSVFPLPRGAKRPAMRWEPFQSSRASPADVVRWAATDANTAIVTGRLSRIIVLDLDSEEASREAERLGLPATVEARTPRGRHLYFRHPGFPVPNRAGCPWEGADVRGDGGYVVAPLSVFEPSEKEHADGKLPGRYEWVRSPEGTEVAECPAWLLEALTPANDVRQPVSFGLRGACAWTDGAVKAELERVRSSSPGERNHALNRAAFSLGQLESRADGEQVRAMLHEAALAAGLTDDEAQRTIESGWNSGRLSPRQKPNEGAAAHDQPAHSDFRPLLLWPLEEVRTEPPPFPIDVLGEKWAEWASYEASGASAPVDYVAMGLIVAAAALIGNARRCAAWDKWSEPCIIWGCIVGEPSAGKTPALQPVVKLLDPIDEAFSIRFAKDMIEHQRAVAKAEAARQKWKKLASDPKATTPPFPNDAIAPDAPTCPALKIDDVTPEKLGNIAHARTRATLRRKGSGFEADVLLAIDAGQLSVRSSHAAMDIPAEGTWTSPIFANGPALRRLAPKLKGPDVTLTYVTGRLFLDNTSIPAREA